MTVPDTICGLEVRHCRTKEGVLLYHYVLPDTSSVEVGTWCIYEPTRRRPKYAASRSCGNDECDEWTGTEAEVIAAVEDSIRSVAAECRAFADKVLGEK